MKTGKTVFKAFVDREKEVAYLNEMNAKGWKLAAVRFSFYTFDKTEPNKYKTVFYFAKREHQTTFVRTVTECGGEIAHQSNEGKCILFYVNVPVYSENIDFLTDNQSKLDFKRRLSISRKREAIATFAAFVVAVSPVLYVLPAMIKILLHDPEKLGEVVVKDPIGAMLFFMFIIGGTVCGIMSAYIFNLYCRSKKEIKTISSEMKIFE